MTTDVCIKDNDILVQFCNGYFINDKPGVKDNE